MKDSVVAIKALKGCWTNLWPETLNDFWGFPNQQDDIRNNFMLTHKVPEGGFAKFG
jgi:hypothetical protein